MRSTWRYLTLSEARALTCPPGCSLCCDSSLNGGTLTWGKLPEHRYRGMNGGKPLIRPLEHKDGKWRVRRWRQIDGQQGDGTPFRCAARTEEGCAIYKRRRPKICGDFPVFTKWVSEPVRLGIPVRVRTEGITECVWWATIVVPETWGLLEKRKADGSINWNRLRAVEQHVVTATVKAAIAND